MDIGRDENVLWRYEVLDNIYFLLRQTVICKEDYLPHIYTVYTIQFDDNKIIILFIYQVPVLTWIIIYRRLKPMSDAAKIIKNKLMFFFSEFCDTVLFVTN